jgi:hypothetical protein
LEFLWKSLKCSKGERNKAERLNTVLRYPITVTFRLSEADAFRLQRLLNKYGSGLGNRSDNARFRAMLMGIDNRPWEHTSDSGEDWTAFEENKHMDELELSQFEKKHGLTLSHFHKHMARLHVAPGRIQSQNVNQGKKRPLDPDDPADDRNWDFGESEAEAEEE